MNPGAGIGLFDLIVLFVVIGAVVAALRRGGGLLAALAAGAGALLVCWLISAVLLAWGPAGAAGPVGHSKTVDTFPPPLKAFDQIGRFFDPGPPGPGARP